MRPLIWCVICRNPVDPDTYIRTDDGPAHLDCVDVGEQE